MQGFACIAVTNSKLMKKQQSEALQGAMPSEAWDYARRRRGIAEPPERRAGRNEEAAKRGVARSNAE